MAFAEHLRRDGRRVVFTNGVFDLLHPGHVRYLQAARAEGDALIVAVNSDRSVRANKGPERPIVPETERAEVVAALACVDASFVFDEETPDRVIRAIQPDVLVKGADWAHDAIVGRDVVEARGGRVVRAPIERGYSTTDIVTRVRQSEEEADVSSSHAVARTSGAAEVRCQAKRSPGRGLEGPGPDAAGRGHVRGRGQRDESARPRRAGDRDVEQMIADARFFATRDGRPVGRRRRPRDPAVPLARGRSLPRVAAALRRRLGACPRPARVGDRTRAPRRRLGLVAAAEAEPARAAPRRCPSSWRSGPTSRPRTCGRCSRGPGSRPKTRWTSTASTACAAASWTSSRPATPTRCGWSSSATPSSRSAVSIRPRSVRWPRSIA